jgi:aspartyl-tRNA(Asn)/glutamyl-tRNA(Gln) amidotransferase subunit A
MPGLSGYGLLAQNFRDATAERGGMAMWRRSSRERLEEALDRLAARHDPAVFTRLYEAGARDAADAADRRAADGRSLGALDGALISIKDLFDVAGEVTMAGAARPLADASAERDAEIVRRLRAAGAVILGKTNMTEFAFSGLGLNPHYGTPGNARDPSRIPGGSSAGAGVAVGLGIGEIAIGTDTGGSVRIPAALNGVVGFKPTAARVPRQGALPLSYTLDSIGPLAATVALCAAADQVMSGEARGALQPAPLAGRRVAVVEPFLADCEPAIGAAFAASLARLQAAGVSVVACDVGDLIAAMRETLAEAPIVAVEAAEIHAEALAHHRAAFDPQVLARLLPGLTVPAPRYVAALRRRERLVAALDARLAAENLILAMPTTPLEAPPIAAMAEDAAYRRTNMLMLRNTSFGNFFDLCGISLPMPKDGLPAGFMLLGRQGDDAALLSFALSAESCLPA